MASASYSAEDRSGRPAGQRERVHQVPSRGDAARRARRQLLHLAPVAVRQHLRVLLAAVQASRSRRLRATRSSTRPHVRRASSPRLANVSGRRIWVSTGRRCGQGELDGGVYPCIGSDSVQAERRHRTREAGIGHTEARLSLCSSRSRSTPTPPAPSRSRRSRCAGGCAGTTATSCAGASRMIVLTLEPGEAEKLAQGAPALQRMYGMPIDPAPLPAAGVLGARLPRRRRHAGARAGPRGAAAAPAARARDGGRAARRSRPDRRCGRATSGSTPASCRAGARATRSSARCRRTSPRRATPSAGGARARPQARRARDRAALHGAELRDRDGTRTDRRRRPRLQPGRGLRDGDRQPRARARAAAEARIGRGGARLGRRAARHRRGRRHHASSISSGRGPRSRASRAPCPRAPTATGSSPRLADPGGRRRSARSGEPRIGRRGGSRRRPTRRSTGRPRWDARRHGARAYRRPPRGLR